MPGKKIPTAATAEPSNCPLTPHSRIDKEPTKEAIEKVGPGTNSPIPRPERNSSADK